MRRAAGGRGRQPATPATSAMSFGTRPPLPRERRPALVLHDEAAVRQQLRVALGDLQRVAGVGLVTTADHDGRALDLLERLEVRERRRARDRAQGVGERVEMLVGSHALAQRRAPRAPVGSMPIQHTTPIAEDRAVHVLTLLAGRGHHRVPSVPDLIVAATAENAGLVVLRNDFDLIAEITGQRVQRLDD